MSNSKVACKHPKKNGKWKSLTAKPMQGRTNEKAIMAPLPMPYGQCSQCD